MRHTPVRMCVICRRHFAKHSLDRWVVDAQGTLVRDEKHCMPGRGFYACSEAICQEKFQKFSPKNSKVARKGAAKLRKNPD